MVTYIILVVSIICARAERPVSPLVYTFWGQPQDIATYVVKWNQNTLTGNQTIILVQDNGCRAWQGNMASVEGMEVVCVSMPTELASVYVHNSINNREFELNCVARFFHIDHLCSARNLERVRFLDGDILMLSNLMFPNLAAHELQSDVIGGIHTGTYYLDISCRSVSEFRSYILESYRNKSYMKEIIEKYGRNFSLTDPRRNRKASNEALSPNVQFSDMHLFRAFTHERTTVILHDNFKTALKDNSGIHGLAPARNVSKTLLVGNYGRYRFIVQVPKQYCTNIGLEKLDVSDAVAVHFQGACKRLAAVLIRRIGANKTKTVNPQ